MLECLICFEEYGGDKNSQNVSAASLPCGHVFCEKCLRSLGNNQPQCPTCRKTFSQVEIRILYLTSVDDNGQITETEAVPLPAAAAFDARKLGDMLRELSITVNPDKIDRVLRSVNRWVRGVSSVRDTEARAALSRILISMDILKELLPTVSINRALRKNLTECRAELDFTWHELQGAKEETRTSQGQLEDTRQELVALQTQLDTAREELQSSQTQVQQTEVAYQRSLDVARETIKGLQRNQQALLSMLDQESRRRAYFEAQFGGLLHERRQQGSLAFHYPYMNPGPPRYNVAPGYLYLQNGVPSYVVPGQVLYPGPPSGSGAPAHHQMAPANLGSNQGFPPQNTSSSSPAPGRQKPAEETELQSRSHMKRHREDADTSGLEGGSHPKRAREAPSH